MTFVHCTVWRTLASLSLDSLSSPIKSLGLYFSAVLSTGWPLIFVVNITKLLWTLIQWISKGHSPIIISSLLIFPFCYNDYHYLLNHIWICRKDTRMKYFSIPYGQVPHFHSLGGPRGWVTKEDIFKICYFWNSSTQSVYRFFFSPFLTHIQMCTNCLLFIFGWVPGNAMWQKTRIRREHKSTVDFSTYSVLSSILLQVRWVLVLCFTLLPFLNYFLKMCSLFIS